MTKTLYVIVNAPLTAVTTERLTELATMAVQEEYKGIYLALTTEGGDSEAAMSLYNILRGLPIQVTTHNVGTVASAGIFLFLAGTARVASPGSIFVFHRSTYDVTGLAPLTKEDLERGIGFLRESDEREDNIIRARTRIADHNILGPNALSVYRVTAVWATANGVVDGVRDFVIPSGSRIETITENSWSAPSASNPPEET